MGIVGAALGAAGSIFGAMGAEQQAAGTSAADYYQAQVAANNAKIAKENAAYTMEAGEASASNFGAQARAKIGTMKAQQGANGVLVNSGSPAAVRSGADQTSMLDALTIRDNAARQAYGYEVQATSDQAQSQLDVMSGQNAVAAGDIGATTSLISGASTFAKGFNGFSMAGGANSVGLPNFYGMNPGS